MTSTKIGCLSRNSIRRHRTRSATNPSSEMVIPTITFAKSSSAPDSVDPSFQDYLQDQGQAKVFLQFGSLKNSMGTPRLERVKKLTRRPESPSPSSEFRRPSENVYSLLKFP